MLSIFKKALVAAGIAGLLIMAAPFDADARYRAYYGRYPIGYDTGGVPFYYRDLGWKPGRPSTAPANPCTFGKRQQNRC